MGYNLWRVIGGICYGVGIIGLWQWVLKILMESMQTVMLGEDLGSSLEIVEPGNAIDLSGSSEQLEITEERYQRGLDYSKDQSSISIHIEDETKQNQKHKEREVVGVESNVGVRVELDNEMPKRKRKEIFGKYKVRGVGDSSSKAELSIDAESDIMKTFDEIFSVGSPRMVKIGETGTQGSPVLNFGKKNGKVSEVQTQQKATQPPGSQLKLPVLKTPEKMLKIPKISVKLDNSNDLLRSQSFFKTPLQLSKSINKSKEKSTISKFRGQILDLSEVQYRISFIEGRQQLEASRDSADFAEILNAEIFASKQLQAKPQQPKSIDSQQALKLEDPNAQKPEPKSPLDHNLNLKSQQPSNNMNPQLNMAESRFSDMYQRIDMSNSMANSAVVRNGYNQRPGNLLGATDGFGTVRSFAKSGSVGFIEVQNLSLIKELGSDKFIEVPEEEQRFPKFFRKAARLNSVMPNMLHPNFSRNFDRQNDKLQQLVIELALALQFLVKMQSVIQQKDNLKAKTLKLLYNGFTLEKFKQINWSAFTQFFDIDKLQPTDNVIYRQWNPEKVEKALQNYTRIVQGYRGVRINLLDQRGAKKYLQIRRKFWDIQKNVLLVAEDMHGHALSIAFPEHYLQYQEQILQEEPIFSNYEAYSKKLLLQKVYRLRDVGDEVSLSEVGNYLIQKLRYSLRFNSSHF